ncbi:hypothetical protein H0B43_40450 [Rhodococcus wratislaviensis]|nr:hypothetical protein [Rhodococcus sp. 4CII]
MLKNVNAVFQNLRRATSRVAEAQNLAQKAFFVAMHEMGVPSKSFPLYASPLGYIYFLWGSEISGWSIKSWVVDDWLPVRAHLVVTTDCQLFNTIDCCPDPIVSEGRHDVVIESPDPMRPYHAPRFLYDAPYRSYSLHVNYSFRHLKVTGDIQPIELSDPEQQLFSNVPLSQLLADEFYAQWNKSAEERTAQKEEEPFFELWARRAAELGLRSPNESNPSFPGSRPHDAPADNLVSINSYSRNLLDILFDDILSVENHLDNAEREFSDGVFAPFWDEVERAAEGLSNYAERIRRLADYARSYEQQSNRLLAEPFVLAPLSAHLNNVSGYMSKRFKAVVREAQRNFQFAAIYEMRRTSKVMISGFTSLGEAIDNLTDSVLSSMNELQKSVEQVGAGVGMLGSDISRLNADLQYRHNEFLEIVRSNRKFQGVYEERVTEMLDNIQRHRRPRF